MRCPASRPDRLGATSRPWASPWCHRCRGCKGRRGFAPTAARRGPSRSPRMSRTRLPMAGIARCRHRPKSRCAPSAPAGATRRSGPQTLVKDDGDGIAVAPQIHQLVGGVAVVGVHRNEPRLIKGKHALHVLDRVIEVMGDFVLVLGASAQQARGDAVGPPVEFCPGEGSIRLSLCHRVGKAVGVVFPDFGEIPASTHSR